MSELTNKFNESTLTIFNDCKECKSRYVGCHALCPSYKHAKKQMEEIKSEKIKQKKIDNYYLDKYKRIRKGNRRRALRK